MKLRCARGCTTGAIDFPCLLHKRLTDESEHRYSALRQIMVALRFLLYSGILGSHLALPQVTKEASGTHTGNRHQSQRRVAAAASNAQQLGRRHHALQPEEEDAEEEPDVPREEEEHEEADVLREDEEAFEEAEAAESLPEGPMTDPVPRPLSLRPSPSRPHHTPSQEYGGVDLPGEQVDVTKGSLGEGTDRLKSSEGMHAAGSGPGDEDIEEAFYSLPDVLGYNRDEALHHSDLAPLPHQGQVDPLPSRSAARVDDDVVREIYPDDTDATQSAFESDGRAQLDRDYLEHYRGHSENNRELARRRAHADAA